MSKMDELYNGLYDFCNENHCWNAWNTAKEWNADLGVDYGPACYTALVKAEKIKRRTRFGSKTYEYKIVPTGTIKEAMEQAQRQREKDSAEYTINHYDESIARVRARYEEMIKQAEEQLARDLEWEAEKLEKAKTALAQMF